MLRKLMAALVFAIPAMATVGGFSSPAAADAASAWDAYRAGRYAVAAREIKVLAETGDPVAQFYLGTLHADGLAVRRDYARAAEWYMAAAAKDHDDAKFALGFLYLNGAGEGAGAVAADPARAVGWLKASAQRGNVSAQSLLAVLYGGGREFPGDSKESFRWAHVAALRGDAAAQYQMGRLKAETLDIPSWSEAYSWFLLAERRGYPGARESAAVVAGQLDAKTIAEATVRADDFVPRPAK